MSEKIDAIVVIPRQEAIEILANEEVKSLSPSARENILLTDWWYLEPDSTEFLMLPIIIQENIQNNETPVEAENVMYDPLLVASLRERYRGVTNEYITDALKSYGYEKVIVTGEKEAMLPCVCCGYETLWLRGHYEICAVCFWEDDGNLVPERFSSANHMTLAEARLNFTQFGASNARALPFLDPKGKKKYSHSINPY